MIQTTKAALVEYALSIPPLILLFEFNPQSFSRTRTVNVTTGSAPGTLGGYDFALPTETPRVSQGVQAEPESFSIEIMFDATDRMNDGNEIATTLGIEPELDTLRTMVEPKSQGPGGVQMLASLGLGEQRAFQRNETASVLLFVWGTHVLPVFLTSVQVDEKSHLPNLIPYRANVTMSMRVIEGNNPFYEVEKIRQVVGAAIHTADAVVNLAGGLF